MSDDTDPAAQSLLDAQEGVAAARADDFEIMLRRLVHRLRQRPELPVDGLLDQADDLLRRKGRASALREAEARTDLAELERLRRVDDMAKQLVRAIARGEYWPPELGSLAGILWPQGADGAGEKEDQ